ncbi:hypothetical protein ACQP2H_31680 (plasmid) [Micromonospora sp. CA-248260]|uniref:hypothetical protein n=1 Tax=Micromonospora sp. CA-248260 TaxID=3239962 RepID=UPI003D94CC79
MTFPIRPAQLAPVRVGRGTAVHLGSLSSIMGPDRSVRYVAAWCGASGTGDNVRVGEPLTEPITCRTCLRVQPRLIELINASLTGEPTTLPHTGMVVPHAKLHVSDMRRVPGTGGTRARLMLGEHFIGYITSTVRFQPIHGTSIGTADLDGYAADCRTANGRTVNVSDVLGALVREYQIAQRHAAAAAQPDHNGRVTQPH